VEQITLKLHRGVFCGHVILAAAGLHSGMVNFSAVSCDSFQVIGNLIQSVRSGVRNSFSGTLHLLRLRLV